MMPVSSVNSSSARPSSLYSSRSTSVPIMRAMASWSDFGRSSNQFGGRSFRMTRSPGLGFISLDPAEQAFVGRRAVADQCHQDGGGEQRDDAGADQDGGEGVSVGDHAGEEGGGNGTEAGTSAAHAADRGHGAGGIEI